MSRSLNTSLRKLPWQDSSASLTINIRCSTKIPFKLQGFIQLSCCPRGPLWRLQLKLFQPMCVPISLSFLTPIFRSMEVSMTSHHSHALKSSTPYSVKHFPTKILPKQGRSFGILRAMVLPKETQSIKGMYVLYSIPLTGSNDTKPNVTETTWPQRCA